MTLQYSETKGPILQDLNLEYRAGEFALLCGPTGSGKSSLLAAITGLAPFYTGGAVTGEIWLGQGTAVQAVGLRPAQLAAMIAYVNQQPGTSFVAQTVQEELAFGMEQRGEHPLEIASGVLRAAELLNIEHLLERQLNTLSGGQLQRVSIAAALAGGQRILLLDEPTSSLDFESAENLLQTLKNLAVHEGYTVLLVEHRVEVALAFADSVTIFSALGAAVKHCAGRLTPAAFGSGNSAPMVELARKLGWEAVAQTVPAAQRLWLDSGCRALPVEPRVVEGQPSLKIANLNASFGKSVVVNNAEIDLVPGKVTAVFGPNGAGKSTLLWKIFERMPTRVVLLPQDSDSLLLAQLVSGELADADERASVASGTAAGIFHSLIGKVDTVCHHQDLSAGQRVALALAIQLVRNGDVVLLDEPTRGLDYEAKHQLELLLQELISSGKSILLASHDSEFLARVADRMYFMDKGLVTVFDSVRAGLSNLGLHTPQLLQITGSAMRIEEVFAKAGE